MNNNDFNMNMGSLYQPSYSDMLYFNFSKRQRVCPPRKPRQTGSTEGWKHRTVSPTLLLYFPRLHKLFVSTIQMQVFVELSDNSSSINPQQIVKICNSAVAQHSIVPSPAVCALNGALFGLSWLVRFTFEYIQCCQSG